MSRRPGSGRRRPARPGPRPPDRAIEAGPDGYDYEVLPIPGARAVKTYRCPGCDQEIRPGAAHLVVWRVDHDGEDRRHWHRPCWTNRHNRGPTRRQR